MTDQCNRCRFWHENMKLRDASDADWGFGSCRRTPPAIIDSLVAAQIERPTYGQQIDLEPSMTDLMTASRYPVTFATGWCGKFAKGEA